MGEEGANLVKRADKGVKRAGLIIQWIWGDATEIKFPGNDGKCN